MIAMAELSGAATRTIPDLSFGVSYIRVVEASRKRNGDTLKGASISKSRRDVAAWPMVADWQTAVFRSVKIQADGTVYKGSWRTRQTGQRRPIYTY